MSAMQTHLQFEDKGRVYRSNSAPCVGMDYKAEEFQIGTQYRRPATASPNRGDDLASSMSGDSGASEDEGVTWPTYASSFDGSVGDDERELINDGNMIIDSDINNDDTSGNAVAGTSSNFTEDEGRGGNSTSGLVGRRTSTTANSDRPSIGSRPVSRDSDVTVGDSDGLGTGGIGNVWTVADANGAILLAPHLMSDFGGASFKSGRQHYASYQMDVLTFPDELTGSILVEKRFASQHWSHGTEGPVLEVIQRHWRLCTIVVEIQQRYKAHYRDMARWFAALRIDSGGFSKELLPLALCILTTLIYAVLGRTIRSQHWPFIAVVVVTLILRKNLRRILWDGCQWVAASYRRYVACHPDEQDDEVFRYIRSVGEASAVLGIVACVTVPAILAIQYAFALG